MSSAGLTVTIVKVLPLVICLQLLLGSHTGWLLPCSAVSCSSVLLASRKLVESTFAIASRQLWGGSWQDALTGDFSFQREITGDFALEAGDVLFKMCVTWCV